MNRKQKIIVSITGIFLVLMILVGLTYAYFLTKITGNTNSKSISVTTANLELVYGDENGEIVGDKIQPGSKLTDTNGNEYKTFTVTNNGDDVDYSVVLENVSVTDVEKGTSTTFVSNDFVYTLTCTSSDEKNSPCNNQVKTETTLPLTDSVLLGNNIKKGVIHTYTLVVLYKDTGIDQSDDMNKALSARINIIDIRSKNPYDDDKTSLAYNIINNASYAKGLRSKLSNSSNTVIGTLTKTNSEMGGFILKTEGNDIIGSVENGYSISGYYFSERLSVEYTADSDIALFSAGKTIQAGGGYTSCDKVDKNIYKYAGNMSIDGSGYLKRFLFKGCDENGNPILQALKVEESFNIKDIAETTIRNNNNLQLISASDDYGTSYFYRGNVQDNFVSFAGMCWRIVRINGDGSIKLYLVNKSSTCSENISLDASLGTGIYGYSTTNDNKLKLDFVNSEVSGLADIFKKFQTTAVTPNISNYLNYLKAGDWCIDVYNNKNFSLKCDEALTNKFSDKTNMYVGTLTADELIFAGTIDFSTAEETLQDSNRFYLNYGYSIPTLSYMSGSIENIDGWKYFVAPYGMYVKTSDQTSSDDYKKYSNYIYSAGPFVFDSTFPAIPAVNLKKGTTISGGDGTISNPYVVKTN